MAENRLLLLAKRRLGTLYAMPEFWRGAAKAREGQPRDDGKVGTTDYPRDIEAGLLAGQSLDQIPAFREWCDTATKWAGK